MAGPPRFTSEAEVQDYLWSCVQVDPMALSEEFARVPSDLAYWNERYASAHLRAGELRVRCDRVLGQRRGELQIEIEQERLSRGLSGRDARVSAVELKAAAEFDSDYLAVCEKLAVAEAERTRLYGVLDAILRKGDMLVSLGAQQRAEINAEMRVSGAPRSRWPGPSDG